MDEKAGTYEWTRRDKVVYGLTLIPFVVAFVGAAYLLGTISIWLAVTLIVLYLAGNLFQAACCVGCPYRGRYCPAIFGVYPANWLSTKLYSSREHDPRTFALNATLAEIVLAVMLIFAGFWLATLNWIYLAIFAALLAVHVVLFLTLICPRCSYSGICPAGKIACLLFRRPKSRAGTGRAGE
jgi:hypothetical protein